MSHRPVIFMVMLSRRKAAKSRSASATPFSCSTLETVAWFMIGGMSAYFEAETSPSPPSNLAIA